MTRWPYHLTRNAVILWVLLFAVGGGCGRKARTESSSGAKQSQTGVELLQLDSAAATSAFPLPIQSSLPLYQIDIKERDLGALENSAFSNETVPATFLFEGARFEGARIRYRGAWARGWPKKALKIFFSKESRPEGVRCLNLNSGWRDPALIREPFAYYVYSVCGAIASNARLVRVEMNGNFRGIYIDVEQPDKPLLKRFQLEGAAVYKANSQSNQADERDFPSTAIFAHQYEKQTRKTEDHTDLQQFCHELATAKDTLAFFNDRILLDRYINFLAATVLAQNWDGFNKNHFLVHDVKGSGKWLPLPWDLDRTLGDHWDQSFDEARLPLLLGTRNSPGITGWNRLENRFFSEPVLTRRFLDRLQELLENEFTEAKLFPVLDQFEAQISEWQQAEIRRWPRGPTDFHKGIRGVKSYVEQRRKFLLGEIARLRRSL